MKDFYISDCTRHENKIITSNFVVVSKQIKPKKTGEPYLALTLGDRSGQLEAKMWDNVEEVLNAFEQDDFLKIKGLVNKYKNRFQLTIHKVRKLGESEIDFSDYLPKTTRNIDELWQTLTDFVGSFQNPHLKSLVRAFMSDPEIAAAYRNAPAAKPCITLISVACWTTSSRFFVPATWSAETILRSTAICCLLEYFSTTSARSTSSPTIARFPTPRADSCSGT